MLGPAPGLRANDVVRVVTRHGATVDPSLTGQTAALVEPFRYDGSIDGLRGVPVTELHAVAAVPARGKTPSLADRLHTFGVDSVYDLLMLVPRRYLPRDQAVTFSSLRALVGTETGFLAKVASVNLDRTRHMVKIRVVDDLGDSLTITFFNALWQGYRFREGDEVSVWARSTSGSRRKVRRRSR